MAGGRCAPDLPGTTFRPSELGNGSDRTGRTTSAHKATTQLDLPTRPLRPHASLGHPPVAARSARRTTPGASSGARGAARAWVRRNEGVWWPQDGLGRDVSHGSWDLAAAARWRARGAYVGPHPAPQHTRASACAARAGRGWTSGMVDCVCAKINGSCSWDPRREQPEGAGARDADAATFFLLFVLIYIFSIFVGRAECVARAAPRRQRARSRTPRAKGGCARAVACATTVHRLYNASRGRPGGGSRTRRPTHRLDRRDPTQHHAPRSGVDSSAHVRHSSDALAALTAIHVSAVCGPRGAAPRRRTRARAAAVQTTASSAAAATLPRHAQRGGSHLSSSAGAPAGGGVGAQAVRAPVTCVEPHSWLLCARTHNPSSRASGGQPVVRPRGAGRPRGPLTVAPAHRRRARRATAQ